MTEVLDIRVEIRELPEMRLAVLPHRGAYAKVGPVFARLTDLVSARGFGARVLGRAMLCYDDPSTSREEDLRAHAGLIVNDEMRIFPPLTELVLPAGRHAVMLHRGSYSGLAGAHAALLREWLPGSGERSRGRPAVEIYLNRPGRGLPESELMTELRLPLA